MKITFFLITLLFSAGLYSQDRVLVSSLGINHQVGEYLLTSSVGEPIIGSVAIGAYQLHQGFIPFKVVSTPASLAENALRIELYPNPVSDFLILKGVDMDKKHFISLFDAKGRLVSKNELQTSKIDVSSLSPGSYYLLLTNNNQVVFKNLLIKQ
ncbi:T9SS type A sorting domain-containing protein [Carboxylicivirga sp. M1479]|uniref:T9SS type A sorting domain-containing protein n=1 Tax=Carboxylicivirga sp. M1479 TaxID=2594476 RepID=UPI00117815FD|nr:T9SS type A sorting domain-containing protein [Carboxylicivirga sp. M1479]TRX71719.1 T9SS type A sorting domain-containing protein [Carboxylicivirga sp. M1479]